MVHSVALFAEFAVLYNQGKNHISLLMDLHFLKFEICTESLNLNIFLKKSSQGDIFPKPIKVCNCISATHKPKFKPLFCLCSLQCCLLLDALGLPWMRSEGEAEATCAWLNQHGVCLGIC